jgi:hypothetical protein
MNKDRERLKTTEALARIRAQAEPKRRPPLLIVEQLEAFVAFEGSTPARFTGVSEKRCA